MLGVIWIGKTLQKIKFIDSKNSQINRKSQRKKSAKKGLSMTWDKACQERKECLA